MSIYSNSPSGYGGGGGQPYRSPYQQPQPLYGEPQPQPFSPPQGGQIAPGSITYTTSTGPDGNIVYHPFKAVAASYQTPSGVVSGIQWVPAEATQILPQGAQPANAEFAASWNRGYLSKDDQKALKEWQKDEEKRRKKEEKESRRKRDKDRRRDDYEDEGLRKARERDNQARERRKSFNAGGHSPQPGYPASPYSNPPQSPYEAKSPGGGGVYSRNMPGSDLTDRFNDLDVDRRDDKISGLGRPRQYSTNEGDRDRQRRLSGNFGGGNAPSNAPGYAGNRSVYGAPGSAYSGTSPNMRPGEIPYSPTASGGGGYSNPNYPTSPRADNYPPRSTSPFPQQPSGFGGGQRPRSRAGSPVGGFPGQARSSNSPMFAEKQLAAPDGFSRPINAAQAYTPFETMKIQNMDDFYDNLPRMPAVLGPHDVFHEDWIRFVQDLSMAWKGTLPVPDTGGRPPKRATLVADLIDLWNKSFYTARGVEVVLYKGRERRSGPGYGQVDLQRSYDDESDSSSSSLSSSSSSSSSSETDSEDERYQRGQYGRPNQSQDAYRRREKKAEKRRRKKEKKARRKQKEKEKRYALYLTCIHSGGGPGPAPYGGGGGSGISGRMSPMPAGAPGYAASAGQRMSPMPRHAPLGGRMSPMPQHAQLSGRMSPMPGGY